MTSQNPPERDNPRYRIKQLTYGFSLGQWIVVDGLTVALEPVKTKDRRMWTGTEEAAQHYCDQLNNERVSAPNPLSLSQLRKIVNPAKSKTVTPSVNTFTRCECGVMCRKGIEHTCKV